MTQASPPVRPTHFPSPSALLVAAAGLTAGAFLSRLLSESFYSILGGLARWPGTLILTLAGGLLTVAVWDLAARFLASRYELPRNRIAAASAVPFIPFFLLTLYLFAGDVNLLQGWTLFIGALALAALLAGQITLAPPLTSLETSYSCRGRAGVGGRGSPARWADVLLPTILALGTFALYLRTLSPTIGQADSFEFQVVAYTLGVAHPTGYPLYILLGKLFTLLPVGDVAYRVNLTSPIFASLAVTFLYLFVHRLMRSRWAALCAALTFAFARTLWSQAAIAEVYTLNAFFVAL
ncbi:MAG: DUF2723 domain-containing protein, partial [Chloroflexota bacterium]|nr:DUF2723 domain-containing protein [Chloroflexota bacterium]